MGDFDDYEYLEKTTDAADEGAPGGHNANGDEAGRRRGGRHEDEDDERAAEDEFEEERRISRRGRSSEDRGRRERDLDDGPPGAGAPVRERDRSRERDRDDDRDKDRDRGHRRESYRDRGRDRERYEPRGGGRHRDRDYERGGRSRERGEGGHYRGSRKEKQEKEEPEADPERDQRTVFAYQINLKADERDVYEFFSRAGKVRDVRLIMDRTSRRSKGVGYIEFYDAMSVPLAIALRGQLLLGTPVMVKPSEAEKNLAAQTPLPVVSGMPGMPPVGAGFLMPTLGGASKRLHISNLHVNMNEEQLKQVVEPFGALESVEVPTDPASGQCKGFGYVQYQKMEDARIAQQYLNDMDLAGLKIKVQFVPENFVAPDTGPPVNPGELDDDEGGGLSLNAQSRAALMQKLDRSAVGGAAPGAAGVAPGAAGPGLGLLAANPLAAAIRPGLLGGLPGALPGAAGLPGMGMGMLPGLGAAAVPGLNPLAVAAAAVNIGTPSPHLLLTNMWKAEELDDEFEQDIREDVEAECEKFGKVVQVHVDRSSTSGHVYVKFAETEGATKAREALHNRWFAGKPISATFVDAADFEARVSS